VLSEGYGASRPLPEFSDGQGGHNGYEQNRRVELRLRVMAAGSVGHEVREVLARTNEGEERRIWVD
jgi:hypothetical protein